MGGGGGGGRANGLIEIECLLLSDLGLGNEGSNGGVGVNEIDISISNLNR